MLGAASGPRRLFLLLHQGSFRLLIVTLHAPHRAMEVSAIQAWWAETTRLLDVHAQSAIVLLGGDMNAAVGSIPTEEIGSQDADLQDASGDLLAELLKAHQMWLPCTFPACHSGPSGTYVQKRKRCFFPNRFYCLPEGMARQGMSPPGRILPFMLVKHTLIILPPAHTLICPSTPLAALATCGADALMGRRC